jgi:hypothetical protein
LESRQQQIHEFPNIAMAIFLLVLKEEKIYHQMKHEKERCGGRC